jgi:DNA-cytosine methyltransferase
MRYLSVCSGIEAASVAWHHLGWKPAAFSEIDPFPSAVLAHRFPDVPNLGDMSKFKEWTHEGLQGPGSIDLLVGGTPCQSFSVAGLRKGLEDPRGNLMLTYLGIADHLKPKWIVWENVPGVLSSNQGRDFGTFLGALGQLGYQYAYRVLDAQWVRTHSLPRAVPQRRRRVFVVGYLGEVNRAAEVLFKLESLRGDPPARRKTGEGFATVVAPSLTASNDPSRSPQSSEVTQQVAAVVGALACNTGPNGHDAGNFACNQSVDAGHVIPQQVASVLYAGQEVVGSLTARSGRNNGISNDDLDAKRVICMAHGQANADIAFDHSTTLTCLHEAPIAAIPEGTIGKEPAWIPCPEECGDFFCNLHQMHTSDCECPPIDEWETDPYGLQDEGPAAKSVISFKRNASSEFPSVNEPGEVCLTLQAINSTAVVIGASGKEDREASDGTCMTLKARMGTGGGNVPMVAMAFAQNQVGEVRTGEVFNTLNTNSNASGRNTPMVAMAVRTANTSANGHGVSFELSHTLDGAQGQAVAIGNDCCNGAITGDVAATMGTHGSSTNSSGPTVMHEVRAVPLKEPDDLLPESPTRKSTKGWGDEGDPAFTLRTAAVPGAAIGGNPAAMQVRRLTVGECEALQGFPRDWTQVPYRGKPASDGPRYKALGNSMATNCMEWIGFRIQACEEGTL